MAIIKTSKGDFIYDMKLPQVGCKLFDYEMALENLSVLKVYLDKVGINWGPAFGTLIGIVRNDDFLPWAQRIDLYILKEDEERFKDVIWMLAEVGFRLERYERRGIYGFTRGGISVMFYVFRKISYEVRHSGGRDFIFEKYIQNTVKWDFKGVELNVPAEVDEYLTFQYGDWIIPKNTMDYKRGWLGKIACILSIYVKDHLPDSLYYSWILKYHQRHFKQFKQQCIKNGCPLPKDVELSYWKPRKGKKVLTVGVYDLLHKGHIELFRRAKGLGDYLIVGVQDGNMIAKYKPLAKVLNSTDDRMYTVKSIRYVDEAIVYDEVSEIVKKIDFDVFVSGPDQIHSGFQTAIKWCEEHGKEFIILARTEGVSSSELKARIVEKQIKLI